MDACMDGWMDELDGWMDGERRTKEKENGRQNECLVQAPALVPWTWPGLDTAVACVSVRVQCSHLLRSIIDRPACQLCLLLC